ncbi:F-box protein CPR1-like isoform X2 [Papaver somniferum]|uniref:F-box protein CPR1-like isoform X2 n=1 Tax=Papaver somniferum TaxID=3469 RepID=UPI000E703907|nr:F-box protein CPR1-like isoform X2 [Papaver somniferum]
MAAAAARLISRLPEEIQAEIFLKLPVKSILSCKCVCKLWFNLISSPKFINDHLNLSIQNKNNHKLMFVDKESVTGKPLMYSIDYASITSTPDLSCEYLGEKAVLMDYPFEYKKGMKISILGARNGLICFGISVDTKTSICTWNPTTREYRKIHHSNFHNDPKVYCDAGFGYDSKTGDYKMVTIADSKTSDYCEVEVYTFGLHLSKTIHTFPHKYPIYVSSHVVFLNGALHWISCNMSKQDIYHGILTFDISNEKLMYVPLPEKCILHPEDSKTGLYKAMGVLGDCLSLVLVDAKTVEVWVMQDYGVRESWTKRFTTTTQEPIIQYPYWTPMLSLKTGDILMYSYDGFALCDPKKERIGKVSGFFQENICIVRVLTMITSHPQSYVESLVSLNSGTYVKKPRGQKSRGVE